MPTHGAAPRPALPAAVSTLVADLVHGPPAAATVAGAHRFALYLSVGGRVLPLVTADAVALPTAVRLAVSSHELAARVVAAGSSGGGFSGWGVGAGEVVTVGAGRLVLPGCDVVATRSWRPSRVRRATPCRVGCSGGRSGSHLGTRHRWDAVPVLEEAARAATGPGGGWLGDGIRAACSATRRPRGTCGSGGDVVAGLVGRGPGLTPSGDDALAGALLVAHALGAGPTLADAVRARLLATTTVSAALLDAAADGYAARPVVTLVDAAVGGDPDAVAGALPAVLAIGHTSGADTLTGVSAALDILTTCRQAATNGRSAA